MFKVLIVDDMEVLRRDIRRLKLWGETSGFIIEEEAKDGLDALRKLEANSFDLVITDIRMPNMDGIELLHNISEKKLCPVTVLLSDFTVYNYARQAILYGVFDYIGKPVNEDELARLLARIRQHLNEMQEQEQKQRELQWLSEDTRFLSNEIKQVILHIKSGNPNGGMLASNLIDMICDAPSYDSTKILSTIKNTLYEIIDEILQTYKWFDLFIDIDSLIAADDASSRDLEEMKAAAKEILEKLALMISRLMGAHNSDIVSRTCEYVLLHINEEISVKLLAEKLFINKSYLSEIFKQKFGMTLLQYITMAKMERAKKLLQEGNLKKYQIAETLGFKDDEYFGRLFKKYTGVLPRDYQG